MKALELLPESRNKVPEQGKSACWGIDLGTTNSTVAESAIGLMGISSMQNPGRAGAAHHRGNL